MLSKHCLLAFFIALLCVTESAAQSGTSSVEQHLKSVLAGATPFDALTVTYTDLHGLYGGLSMTIHGSGKV